ncbi:MAG TPA: methionine adenosyltransferase, partial [Actinomycetota bacterium]
MTHRYLFSSESVTEGHPDKLADQISDAVLDAIMTVDPVGRVACETLVTTGLVMVAGEITTSEYVDIPTVVRQTVLEIGYTDANFGIDGATCGVVTSIQEQSPDIARGVDDALEHRGGSADDLDALGAGDQGMMFGYACRETDELMPIPIAMAHRLTKRLADVRKAGVVPYLRPDGKSQVSVEYRGGKPVRVDTVLISAQHREEVDVETLLAPDVEAEVIDPVLREFDLEAEGVRVLVNPTGRFEIGGPKADTGLTGRKIMVDTYGGMAPHGGGCFSGKDPTKVDRSAAYMARYVAKNLVASGVADRLQIQV